MKKEKKESKEVLSMKDALSTLPIEIEEKKEKKKSLRDILWEYPSGMLKLVKDTLPFSYIIIFIFVGFLLILLFNSRSFSKIIAGSKERDTFTEGSVGAITSFNPLFLSANYVDKIVESLVFNKFIYIDEEGNPIAGIANKWTASADKSEYVFEINDNILWQNGNPLTIDDIMFTFQTAQTLAEEYEYDTVGVSLQGVTIEKVGEKSVKFKLTEKNPTFFEAVSIYIVPKLVLEDVSLEDMPFNIFAMYPVGTGKYRVSRVSQNAVYLVDNEYDDYDLDIKNIVFRIFPDYESLDTAFRTGLLDAVGGWDSESLSFVKEYPNYVKIEKKENYKTKLIFFNLRKDSLKEENLRIGLSYLFNRDELLERAKISGVPIYGPYASDSWVYNKDASYYKYNPEKAALYLKNVGYERPEGSRYYQTKDNEILSFTTTYFESESNNRLVDALKEMMEQEGVILKIEKLNYTQITQEIIATRDFELLLYEIETTIDPDQYNLWHSLKSNYPDLNLSGYSYERVDILLEDARRNIDDKIRLQRYMLFQKYLVADAPVVFLYQPNYVYIYDNDLKGVDLRNINFSYERFHNVQDWEWR
jgi:peptide/nickel transport system substrate-binding protein